MVQKTGRNAPCPCGSGKKYKKCCLSKDTAPERERAAASRPNDKPAQPSVVQPSKPPLAFIWDDDDDLDELSNSVIHLIREGKLDEAEKACDELDRRFPELPDGPDRRGMLLEARGETKLAAECYRRAADLARGDGYDPEIADSYLASANKLDPPTDAQGS